MTPDKVIVTVQTASGQCWGDYELPANVPLDKFQGLLLDALIQHAPQQFSSWAGRGLALSFQGRQIPGQDTLSAHGVWDGSYVAVLPISNKKDQPI